MEEYLTEKETYRTSSHPCSLVTYTINFEHTCRIPGILFERPYPAVTYMTWHKTPSFPQRFRTHPAEGVAYNTLISLPVDLSDEQGPAWWV